MLIVTVSLIIHLYFLIPHLTGWRYCENGDQNMVHLPHIKGLLGAFTVLAI